MKKPEAICNFKNDDAISLAVKSQALYTNLNGNPSYPTCAPLLPTLQTNTNTLNTAITAGGTTPTPAQTATINAAAYELKRVLKVICALVNWDANGNEATLLTSGFDVKTYSAPNPKTFKAKLGKLSGAIDLEINSYGVAAYVWQMSPDPISTWADVSLTTLSKTTITGLTPGTKLWFRVKITKGKTVITISDPYTIMVV